MRSFWVIMLLCVSIAPANLWADDELSGQELSKINAVLASLNCKAIPELIEKDSDEYLLRDVFCEDGQFNIRLNEMFKVVAKRAE